MLKIFQIIGLMAILLAVSIETASANISDYINPTNDIISKAWDVGIELTDSTDISIKRGEPYNEANDPALHKSSEPEDGPKHGYFAVSFVVLGIVGLFVYFLKVD